MIQIEGADEVLELLKSLPERVDEVLPESCLSGAEVFLQACQDSAPRRSGALVDSLHIEKIPRGYAVVADAPYANCVNGGTVKMRAEPFMDDAFANNQQNVVEMIDQYLDLD